MTYNPKKITKTRFIYLKNNKNQYMQ